MRKLALVLGAIALLALTLAGTAQAKQPPVSKLTFKLHGHHEMVMGETVSLTVLVQSRSERRWAAVPDATVLIRVDGVEVTTAVTDADGKATFDYSPAAEGEHVMKAVFAGDESHKRAQRAQGFTVAPATVPAG